MTVPKPEEFRRLHRGKKRAPVVLVVALMGAIVVGGMLSIIHPTISIVKEENEKVAALPHKNLHAAQAPIQTVDSELLKHESMFLGTIKNCLPSQNAKCAEFIPENNQGRQRIAVVTPPGEMGNLLFDFIQKVVQQHEKLMSQNQKTDAHPIELFRTSHVPPYGFGKNHGLTKIIRFVPILVMGVADALQNILVESHHHQQHQHADAQQEQQDIHELQQTDITLQDLQVGLRQMLRFHCRLSHVAAHTAMLSLNINDYFDNNEQFMSQLYGFLKMSGNDAQGDAEDEQEQHMLQVGSFNEVQMVSAELGFVSQILTRIQTTLGHDRKVLEVLDQTLLDEMSKSKNLTVWPCPSFWAAADDNDNGQLSSFGAKIAQAMSPNCTAPFAQCWVPRDLCETRGDGPCKEQK